MATIEELNDWERSFAEANGCDMKTTLRGSISFPTDDTFSFDTIELDEDGRPRINIGTGELTRTTHERPITHHLPMPWATK